MTLEQTLDAFVGATADVRGEDPRLNELAPKLLQLGKGQPKEVLDETLMRLVGALNAPHPQVGGLVALMAGCFVEEGADPAVLAKALLPRVEEALTAAKRCVEAVSELPELEEKEEESDEGALWIGGRMVTSRDLQALTDKDPSSAQSLLALDHFCQALIAALTRSPDLLETNAVQALSTPLDVVCEASHFAHFLARLLRVPINEEWFIIDPRRHRGFALEVSGVANAFQVYALVHRALCDVPRSLAHWSPPVPRPAPPEHVLAVADGSGPQEISGDYVPPFTLFRWSAIARPEHIPNSDDFHEWYSMSAVPAELARFGGKRIAVIGEWKMNMVLGVAREFSALRARVTLIRELERRHVIELLHAFSREPHPGQPVPGVGWP